jgi:hypothetical protein
MLPILKNRGLYISNSIPTSRAQVNGRSSLLVLELPPPHPMAAVATLSAQTAPATALAEDKYRGAVVEVRVQWL